MSLDNDTRRRVDGYVQAQMTRKPPFSVDASGYEKKDGETIPRRHPLAKDQLLITPASEVKTTYDIFRRAARKFGNAKALGTRKIVKTHVENKKVKKMVDGQEQEVDKKWTYFELSPYSYVSFVEYEQMALQCGAGLRSLGLSPGDMIHLYGATRFVYSSQTNRIVPHTVQSQLACNVTCRMFAVNAYRHSLRFAR